MSAFFTRRTMSLVISFVTALAVASKAQAVTTYAPPTIVGPNLLYLKVEESPTKIPGPTPAQLFGPPSVSGTVLDFDPMDFDATSSGGTPAMTNSLLSTTIQTTNGYYFTDLTVTETGAYCIMGGTAATLAQAAIVGDKLKVTEVNGVPITPILVARDSSLVTHPVGDAPAALNFPFPGSIRFTGDGGSHDGEWGISISYDIDAALASAGISGHATKIDFCLDNILKAASEEDSLSFIDKKDFYITTTLQVPEPSTFVLAGFGLIGLAFTGRKLKKAKAA